MSTAREHMIHERDQLKAALEARDRRIAELERLQKENDQLKPLLREAVGLLMCWQNGMVIIHQACIDQISTDGESWSCRCCHMELDKGDGHSCNCFVELIGNMEPSYKVVEQFLARPEIVAQKTLDYASRLRMLSGTIN